jgi:hypothetical protein
MAAGLRNDFNTPLDQPLSLPVCLEIIERQILHHATDALDGVDNVRQARDERARRH